MNKKLLLSFAVFATAVSVNAQKSLYKGIAKKSMNVEFQTNAVIESKTEINPVVMGDFSSKKRLVTKTIKDTLAIAGNKKTYAHPHHAFTTNRTMKLKLYKNGNDTEFLSANQRYDNTQPLKLNGFGVSLTAYHDNTPVVALVTLRSKKTKQLDSIVPVELSINVVKNSAGTAATSATRWFKPTTPISISDTFMIEVLPKVETDSVGVTATGAYYGSTRAVAKIDGTTLTVNDKSPANDTTYSGWATDKNGYFKGGFVVWNSALNDFFITGTNVLPGTYITGQTGAFTYTVNKTQTVAETNISQNLKVYKTFNGLLGVKAVTAGKASFDYYFAYDNGNGKSIESDWLMYPDVEYTVSSDPKANDVCKDADGSVSVSFDATNRNVLENPTLNKLAFFQKYLGLDKTKNYFYSTVQNGKGSTKFVGMIDFKSTSLTIDTKLDSLNKVDTLFMVDYILPYGFSKTAAAVTFGHLFPISSKVTPAANITPVSAGIKCYLYDAKTVLPGIGGIAPYTGLPKIGDAAGKFSVVDVNGCKGDITTTAIITSDIKEIVAKATVTDAKCSGNKAIVVITATGGTGTLVLPKNDTLVAVATTKSYVVKDANLCEVKVDAVIKNAPAAIVPVATVTDAKCSGNKAIVAITATGGTGTLVLPKNDTLVAEATTKSYVVKDANLCEVKVDATIKAAPAAIVLDTVAVSADNKTKNNGLAVVKVTGGVAPYTYLWNDAAATKNDTLSKVIGAFKVTVTDANGCTKVADAIIRDKKVSVTELGLTNIAVYPNPVKETLNVRFDATSIATVELVNVAGQVLDSKTNSDVTFNTAGLVAGMYFVNIKVAEGVYTHKIIKE